MTGVQTCALPISKEDGVKFLKGAVSLLANKGIILISTPNYDNVLNNPVYGNEYEVHKSRWYPEDFERLTEYESKIIPGRAWTVVLHAGK